MLSQTAANCALITSIIGISEILFPTNWSGISADVVLPGDATASRKGVATRKIVLTISIFHFGCCRQPKQVIDAAYKLVAGPFEVPILRWDRNSIAFYASSSKFSYRHQEMMCSI